MKTTSPPPALHGANVLISIEGKYLLIHQKRGGIALPGGGLEGSETPHQAVMRETFEEIGGILNPRDVILAATCIQRVPLAPPPYRYGFLFLYVANGLKFSSEKIDFQSVTAKNLTSLCLQEEEVVHAELLSIEEILKRNGEFGLAYKRMVLLGHKFNQNRQHMECALSDFVEFGGESY